MSELEKLFPSGEVWNYENGFYLTSDPSRIGKLLAHYELYQRIVGLPGQVVELGVYKGASLVRFATFRDLLESRTSRRVVGFDAFGAFPRDGLSDDDAAFVDGFEDAGGHGYSADTINDALERKSLGNVELVAGDVTRTLPEYLERHPEFRVALLHLDMDVYEPTRLALELLAPRVVRGGLVVVDDYATVAGATNAVDEFFADRPERIRKLDLAHIPAYIEMG